MSFSRFLARQMLAAPFVVGGIDTLRNPAPRVEKAAAVAPAMAAKVGLPTDTELLVKVNAGVHVGAGILLGLGRFRRIAALLLLGSLVPTTVAGHRFWEESDPKAAATQRMQFAKNLAAAGGLLHEAFDRPARLRRVRKAAAAKKAAGGDAMKHAAKAMAGKKALEAARGKAADLGAPVGRAAERVIGH